MLESVVIALKAEQAADVQRYQDDVDRSIEVYIDLHNLVSGLGTGSALDNPRLRMSGLHGTKCGDLGDDNGSVLCQIANMYFSSALNAYVHGFMNDAGDQKVGAEGRKAGEAPEPGSTAEGQCHAGDG